MFPCSAPTDAPADLRVSKVDSTKAHIHWTPVDLTSVQGEFKEYRVSRGGNIYPTVAFASCFLTPSAVSSSQLYYWRDASLVPGLEVNREKRTKGFYSTVSEPSSLLSELLPFSRYKMFMVVANTHYEGPPSNTAEFTTKEGGEDRPSAPDRTDIRIRTDLHLRVQPRHLLPGSGTNAPACIHLVVPDAPRLFTINRKNLDTVHLEWGQPLEPNGILIGYQLKYQTGELLSNCRSYHCCGNRSAQHNCPSPSLGAVNGSRVGRPLFETFLPNVTSFTLRLPDRSTRYKFFVSAVTQVGSGEIFAQEMPRSTNEGDLLTLLTLKQAQTFSSSEETRSPGNMLFSRR